MKRISSVLAVSVMLFVLPLAVQAQRAVRTLTSPAGDLVTMELAPMAAAGDSGWFDVHNNAAVSHMLTFTYSTQPSAVTVKLQCSNDAGATSSDIGSSTSTTGATITGTATCGWINVNISGLTGSIRMRPVYRGIGQPAVSLDGATLSLDTTGLATTAKQDTINTSIGTTNTKLNGGLPAALGTGGGVKVDGSGTALPISGTVTATANAGTNLNTSALALETGGNLAATATVLGATSDAAASAGGTGSVSAKLREATALLNSILNTGIPCTLGCTGGTSDTDDGSVAGAQTTGIQIGLSYMWNGSNWVRTVGDATNGLKVQSSTADAAIGATPTSNPVPGGCENETSPTAITDGKTGLFHCDTSQRQIVVGAGTAGTPAGGLFSVQGATGGTPVGVTVGYSGSVSGGTASMTGTTSTSVISGTASNYIYVESCSVSNTHASVDTLVDLQDGSGGTVLWTFTAPHGYGGESHAFGTHGLKVPTSGNGLFAVDETTGAAVKVFCSGYKSTVSQ